MSASEAAPPALPYVIGRVHQGVRRELNVRLGEWDLSLPHFTTLSVLRRRPDLSNAQLARRSLVTPQSMIDIVSSLEQRGLVARTADPAHGRILRARLTPEGRRIVDAVAPAVAELEDEMLADVPDKHREILVSGMISCMRRLSGHSS